MWRNLPAIKTQLVPTMVEAIPVPATKDLLVQERIAKTRMNVMMALIVMQMLFAITPLEVTIALAKTASAVMERIVQTIMNVMMVPLVIQMLFVVTPLEVTIALAKKAIVVMEGIV